MVSDISILLNEQCLSLATINEFCYENLAIDRELRNRESVSESMGEALIGQCSLIHRKKKYDRLNKMKAYLNKVNAY